MRGERACLGLVLNIQHVCPERDTITGQRTYSDNRTTNERGRNSNHGLRRSSSSNSTAPTRLDYTYEAPVPVSFPVTPCQRESRPRTRCGQHRHTLPARHLITLDLRSAYLSTRASKTKNRTESLRCVPFRFSVVSICFCATPMPLWLVESRCCLGSPSLADRSGA